MIAAPAYDDEDTKERKELAQGIVKDLDRLLDHILKSPEWSTQSTIDLNFSDFWSSVSFSYSSVHDFESIVSVKDLLNLKSI